MFTNASNYPKNAGSLMDKLKKFLTNQWVIILSLIGGVFVGIYLPNIALTIEPIGKIYVKLLIMCCTIMLPAIIVSSIGKISTHNGSASYVVKIFSALVLTFFAISIISIAASYMVSPITAPNNETVKSMGKLIIKNEAKTIGGKRDALKPFYFVHKIHSDDNKVEESRGMKDIIVDFFPENIFKALAENETIKILIFSIIFGIILKYMHAKTATSIIGFLDNLFETFNTLLTFLLYFLPFGLIAIMAEQTIGLDFKIVVSLLKLGLLIALVILIVFAICIVIVKYTSKKRVSLIFKTLKEPMFLSFVAENNLIAIPSLIRGMVEDLGFDKDKVDLTVPLWLSFEIHSSIMFMAVASVFVLQLYNIDITLSVLGIVVFCSIIAGLSSMAAPAPMWVGLIAMVLGPLDVPSSPIIFALFLFEPFFAGILYLLNAVISCAAASLLSRKNGIVSSEASLL